MTFAMNDPCLLSDLNRYVGVALAVVGSVVVAPRGTVLLWRSVTDWPPQRKQRLRGRLARFLAFRRRDVTIHAASAGGVGLCVRLDVLVLEVVGGFVPSMFPL